jgi:hypothetical protein
MKKRQRQINLLIKVKQRIKISEYSYICWAIEDLAEDTIYGEELTKWISVQLNGKSCYRIWMLKNHPAIYHDMRFQDFIEARLQWIDHMISVLQEDLTK